MSKKEMQPFQVLEPENKQEDEPVVKSYKGKWDPRLITFCITNFVINVGISQIAPFYPQLASLEAGLNYTQIGIVFGINPLGSIFGSLLIGRMLSVWGRRRAVVVSLVMQWSVQTLFGTLNYMTGDKWVFFSVSCFTRIIQGFSRYLYLIITQNRSVYSTVTFAYIPLFWPGEFQKKLAIMETMTALGLLFGPIIGSVLNSLFGYSVPFYVIGGFFLLSIIPIMTLMPSDKSLKSFQSKKKLPIWSAFTSVKAMITVLNITIILCGYIYINPFFVNHVASFGYSENIAALILTIPSLSYMVGLQVVQWGQKICKKTFMMSIALPLCFLGNMLEAPFYGLDDSLIPVNIGLVIVGFAQALSLLPSIPQLIEFLTPVLNDPTLKAGVSDISSALFITGMGLGSLLGPLVGGVVYDSFGGNVDPEDFPKEEQKAFQKAMIALGIMQLFVGVLFFFFADGYKGWIDLFRRFSTKKESEEQKPLIKKDDSDGIISDNDSQGGTDVDSFTKQMTEKELLEGPAEKKIVKIRKEKI